MCLAYMANVCCGMCMTDKLKSDSEIQYALQVMTSAIILYDHVEPEGVFCKSSPIQIVKCLKMIKKYNKKDLMSCVRFSTLNYSNSSTPSAVVKIVEVQ